MPIDILPLWHASLRHPAGSIPLPKGEPCMYTYICKILVFSSLSLRTSTFSQNPEPTLTQEGRPEPVVEV